MGNLSQYLMSCEGTWSDIIKKQLPGNMNKYNNGKLYRGAAGIWTTKKWKQIIMPSGLKIHSHGWKILVLGTHESWKAMRGILTNRHWVNNK